MSCRDFFFAVPIILQAVKKREEAPGCNSLLSLSF